MPIAIYILGLCIFAETTSEFMVAGMMPSLAAAFHVSLADVGNLVSAYALSIVAGGPLLTLWLRGARRKPTLLGLLLLFLLGQLTGAMADSYAQLLASRVICGVAESAFFGVALALAAEQVGPQRIARAAALVLNGLMLASVAGLPLAALLDQHWGWRTAFWLVAVLVLLAAAAIVLLVPAGDKPDAGRMREGWRELAAPALWAAYLSSGLIIGAVFAAFTYLAPLLTRVSGFNAGAVPLLFAVYGAATVLGNMLTGRLADSHTRGVLNLGLLALLATLVLLALCAQWRTLTAVCVFLLGFAGLPLNPAMVARVARVGGSGPMANSLHMAVVNLGLTFGAWAGGVCLEAGLGLRAPLWLGAALALLGWLSLRLDRRGYSWQATGSSVGLPR
ncbi:MFS transporter [Chromobacterium sphagni]|uniref:MFS transporter n=1 Tax=Chromobacterium sphagni TaxID=1903179 RepID=A0A1S1WY02_9NEIS|nr:MFS transporter [Chromobacterium sphagni]OHX12171.1 MFS transporter [Chromobacterium sphagni]OHX21744.1 MFS transporter [Chromobacterium sphagni]